MKEDNKNAKHIESNSIYIFIREWLEKEAEIK